MGRVTFKPLLTFCQCTKVEKIAEKCSQCTVPYFNTFFFFFFFGGGGAVGAALWQKELIILHDAEYLLSQQLIMNPLPYILFNSRLYHVVRCSFNVQKIVKEI